MKNDGAWNKRNGETPRFSVKAGKAQYTLGVASLLIVLLGGALLFIIFPIGLLLFVSGLLYFAVLSRSYSRLEFYDTEMRLFDKKKKTLLRKIKYSDIVSCDYITGQGRRSYGWSKATIQIVLKSASVGGNSKEKIVFFDPTYTSKDNDLYLWLTNKIKSEGGSY